MAGKYLIVANWKMNPASFPEAKKLFTAIKKTASASTKYKIILTPPALYLEMLAKSYRGKAIAFGAQNVHWEDTGSYTGEISALMAKRAGASYVLVGHAERRHLGESNDDTRKKVAAVVRSKMTPILCIGESERDERGHYLLHVREQLRIGLQEIGKADVKKVAVAYEPVWAIGQEDAMDAHEMHQMSLYIRKVLLEHFGQAASSIPILYGGSVNESAELAILYDSEVQGLVLGRASADAKTFTTLMKSIAEHTKK